jgi:N-acetylneuraminate synthase
VRPGFGLAPKHLDVIIGAKLNRDVSANTPVKTEVFESILE